MQTIQITIASVALATSVGLPMVVIRGSDGMPPPKAPTVAKEDCDYYSERVRSIRAGLLQGYDNLASKHREQDMLMHFERTLRQYCPTKTRTRG